jgi:hypothetical protein
MSATFLSISSFFAWFSNKTLRTPDPTIHGFLHYCFLHDSVRLSPDCPLTSWTQFLSTRSQTLVWEAETWNCRSSACFIDEFPRRIQNEFSNPLMKDPIPRANSHWFLHCTSR